MSEIILVALCFINVVLVCINLWALSRLRHLLEKRQRLIDYLEACVQRSHDELVHSVIRGGSA